MKEERLEGDGLLFCCRSSPVARGDFDGNTASRRESSHLSLVFITQQNVWTMKKMFKSQRSKRELRNTVWRRNVTDVTLQIQFDRHDVILPLQEVVKSRKQGNELGVFSSLI